MKVYDFIVLFLLLAIAVVLLYRRMDTYTADQLTSLSSNSIISYQEDLVSSLGDLIDIILSQLGGDDASAFTKMNSLITSYNTKAAAVIARRLANGVSSAGRDPPINLPLLSSVSEFNQIFTTAYTSGETAFGDDITGKRNKMILRTFASVCGGLISEINKILTVVEYSADGRPTYTDEIINSSKKTPSEVLTYGFRVLKTLYASKPSGSDGLVISADAWNTINSIFPSTITPYTSLQDISTDVTNNSDRVKYFVKAYSIGAAYIVWLAENKWKLDPTWSF